MKYITGTLLEITALEKKISDRCKFSDGITKRYANIIKHPERDEFAIPIDTDYIDKIDEADINKGVVLSADWFPVFDNSEIIVYP